jgi:hypothetical protein
MLEDTILGPAPLYYMRGLGMGPWVWNVCPCTTCMGWAWDHGFEMCALVLHAWVGHGTMGLKCVPCTACMGWAWDHGFEMCALVLHAWVGHGTMGLKCVPLYYTRGLSMGPWVWNVCPCTTCVGWAWDHGFEMCECTSYIITRVDSTSFRSLFLIISTLVVGESWRLAPYQFGGKYTDDVWVESLEKPYDLLGM